eukprot:scaffold268381_cov56-Attheya_sp.AAC.2
MDLRPDLLMHVTFSPENLKTRVSLPSPSSRVNTNSTYRFFTDRPNPNQTYHKAKSADGSGFWVTVPGTWGNSSLIVTGLKLLFSCIPGTWGQFFHVGGRAVNLFNAER